MEEESTLHLELHKLSCVNSDETMDTILRSIWKTRKTGLRGADKSKLRSLLHLSSPSQLDPVLACLRSLIRKCAYQNFASNELVKLFPPDLPLDLQSILLLSLQKNQEQWKEDIAREQDFSPRTSVSYQVRANVPPSFASLRSSEMQMSPSLWPRQDDSLAQLNHNDFGISAALVPNLDLSGLPACFQCDTAPAENLGNLPCVKSMTWTMENRGSSPADRVAIINLKLHDYSKSPLGETEVKFQLTKDTLEAMLRSMTYISEQLSAVRFSFMFIEISAMYCIA
ncbi:uncharacterized protein LOC107604744 isoform X1 [Arachis ipaensis]|uniref:uncharacterized protein LOC107604744 isoform X1 n=1 Tax=Arachis ipaensis TaxID=130454 RepID=UPI000A2B4744|nr:uncharacterized protein LOC107604744 isoform X1 [Arachis ipaensis]XP_025658208.1 uncharacterized protein LOC112754703 isoform X1 [Arachis hypogaea]